MPLTCCVPGCRSGYQSCTEKASLFCLPSDREQRDRWKRAIPRQETGAFNFESKAIRVCEKHFDTTDIIRADEFRISGQSVLLQREKPKLRVGAIPRIFENLPAYLTKPKPRSRSQRENPPAKRRRVSSPNNDGTAASVSSSTEPCDPEAAGDDGGVISTGSCTEVACQTEGNVCSISELHAVKDQLRSTKQQLRLCQVKIAKLTVQANRSRRSHQDVQKISAREKLIFDHWLMKANAKSATAARYKKEWIYDCLLLKIKSTAVYTFLYENEFLPLPNPRTLYGYLRNLKADFGFDSTLFTVLCEKLEAVPERERRGGLMFDEMSVRKSVHIRESDMALLGKVDFAAHTRPGDHGKDGDHVLVFLFRPFLGGWSQTVGTFCASGAAPGSIVAKLLLQCIVHLTNAGVVVDAVTCDNSTSNQSALRSLGVNGDMHKLQTCFEHPCEPSKQVHVVIDSPHIFKCIRNNLLKVGKFLLPQGQEVFHCHYKDLLDYEEEQAGLRAVPKLTKAHIFPNAFQKMSVKLAVQASHARSYVHESTASAMEFYSEQEDCKKLHGSAATSQFTRTLNKLFDCLNSRRPDHVRFNEAQHIAVLKDSIAWLDNWEKYIKTLPTQRQVCFLSKQTCGALRLTLHSSVALIESLLLSGFRYVLVGNFGQDPLERFFGIVRHVAGDGGQPTVQHFLFIYRMLSVNNLVRPPKRASVEGDGPQLLLKLQGLFDKGKPASSQIDMLAVLFDDVLEEPGEAVNNASVPDVTLSTKECILDYLAGYVVKKFSTISCTDCVGTLKSQTREPTDLIQKKSRGFLQVPSSQLLSLLRIVEGHVEELNVDTVACADVYANIVDQVLLDSRIASAGVGCRLHYVGTTAEVVHFFLRCRLHFYTREKNKLT
ncbi:hypothetical protein HPB51_019259 [Rhipicephalus microplus]|uniref:THAP-type domain-containing protein n=1 Tax=Rhipicephalus microplus TaxID=6941 RepID=A0A9J6F4Y8_RHIMP|nr:hypothetical protein HPB51_019259 [Rhipicephalus microplus]